MLYLAAPMPMYSSREYRLALAEARASGPTVFDVRSAYRSNRDWIERWPVERDRYDSCWVVTGPSGWIGRACAVEIADLAAMGRPVFWWDRSTMAFQVAVSGRSWRRWAQLVIGVDGCP